MTFSTLPFSQVPFSTDKNVLIVLQGFSTKSSISTDTIGKNDSLIVSESVSSKIALNADGTEIQITENIPQEETASTKVNIGTTTAKNDSSIVAEAINTKTNTPSVFDPAAFGSVGIQASGVSFDFEAVRDTFSQKRTVYVERQTTSLDRTVNVSAFPRVAFAQRQTTTGDRTIFVPFEDRRVYVERQTTSAERTVRVAA
jgi:hypothetical protein